MPNAAAKAAVRATLLVIDRAPATRLNRASRSQRPSGPPGPPCRLPQVQRSCQRKLCRMAASTASAVATGPTTPSSRISSVSTSTCTAAPMTPTALKAHQRRAVRRNGARPGPLPSATSMSPPARRRRRPRRVLASGCRGMRRRAGIRLTAARYGGAFFQRADGWRGKPRPGEAGGALRRRLLPARQRVGQHPEEQLVEERDGIRNQQVRKEQRARQEEELPRSQALEIAEHR